MSRRSYSPVFSEVLSAGNISTNAGGQFICNFASVPQAANYSVLYKQFCIKKLEVMILPRLNSFDANNAALTGTAYWQPRIAYAIDDTPSTSNPGSELDVLQCNGAKVVALTGKKVTISCRPKPSIGSQDMVNGGNVSTRIRGPVWLNTDSVDVSYSGVNVGHGAIRYWISANPLFTEMQFDVYFKITFQLRDAA